MIGYTPVVIRQDRGGLYLAITKRPLAINFPVRINKRTYFYDRNILEGMLRRLGYKIIEE